MDGHFVSIEDLLASEWPEAYLDRPADAFFQAIQFAPFDLQTDPIRGLSFETQVILGQRAELGLPGFDLIRLGIGGTQIPTTIHANVYPNQRFLIGPLPVSVLIRHDLFVPMRLGPVVNGVREYEVDTTRDSVAAIVSGAQLDYATDGGLSIRNPVVATVEPFMINGTNLIIALEGASVILRDADWSPSLGALGFERGFRGVYADSAVLHWLPELQISGHDIPGLRLEFENVGIGTGGASFDIALEWPVDFDSQGNFNPDTTELLGSIFEDSWQIAIQRANGTVRVNVPEAFSVDGFFKIPFFHAVFGCSFGLRYSGNSDAGTPSYATHLRVFKASDDPIAVPLPSGQLSVGAFDASGTLSDTGFSVTGQASLDVDLNGFVLSVEDSQLSFSHAQRHDAFSFSVGDVQLGNFANLSDAQLKIDGRTQEDSAFELEALSLSGECQWSDIAALVPTDLQILDLAGSATLRAEVNWRRDPDAATGSDQVEIELFTGVSHLDGLWDFLPPAFRPELISAESFFRVTYADTAALQAATRDDTAITVELSAKMVLRLPDALAAPQIPGFDLIDLEFGEDGLVSAEFRANYQSTGSEDITFTSGLFLEDLIAVGLQLPGNIASEPFIKTSFSRLGMQAGATASDNSDSFSGSLLLEGDFAFRPFVPSNLPFAPQLAALLRDVGLDEISGSAMAELIFQDENFDLKLSGTFNQAGITLDIFNMLATLANGTDGAAEREIDIDFEVGFALSGFTVQIARDTSGDPEDQYTFSFDLDLEVDITGLPTIRAQIRLSDDEFALGLKDIDIPLRMPSYPISVRDLDRLAHPDGIWSQGNLGTYIDTDLDPQIAQFDAIAESEDDPLRRSAAERDRATVQLRKALLQLVMQVQSRVASQGKPVFQSLIYADTLVHETMLGVLKFDTHLYLGFPDIKISVPFDNPSGIAISGEGRIKGFADDDPLKPIEDYSLTLGLSSEYIFARLSGGKPIPIPAFGSPYDDGSVSIDNISLAYGYSKNSFAFGFAGQMVWPSRLIEDTDLSKTLGAGVRLPRYNKIAFQLDTIVLTIGKVTLVIPLPQFDIDLRTPNTPDFTWDGNRRRPYWDGLEVIAQDTLHVAFKRLAFSPFFGFVLAPNIKFDGDIEIGDDRNGATLIIDDLLWFAGVVAGSSAIIPITYILDPTAPFFQTLTANLRIAGFEINFTLERPFPNPSPLAVFEAFGLISDPLMEIDPDGALANTFFIRMDNAYVRLPEFVMQMFPGAAGVVNKRYGFRINLGTLITLVQQIAGPASNLMETLETLPSPDLSQVTALSEAASQLIDPAALLTALPPELRKFRVGGRVGGFEASACIVLATPDEARAAFLARTQSPPAQPVVVVPQPAPLPATPDDASGALDQMLSQARPAMDVMPQTDITARERAISSGENLTLFQGIEFRQFDADDLDRIPVERLDIQNAATLGVFFGARLRLAGNQRIRFLGRLFQNGSFAMTSVAEARPLAMTVFGIPVALPFSGYGRLSLIGGQNRTGFWGRIEAEGHVSWIPIPGVLSLEAGKKDRPARLSLFGDGRFDISAPVTVTLFNGAAEISGTCRVSHEQLAFYGRLLYAPGAPKSPKLITLDLNGAGVVNPVVQSAGSDRRKTSFTFGARGDVTLLGQKISDLAVQVTDHSADFAVSFRKSAAKSPGNLAPILGATAIAVDGRCQVNLRRKTRPEFSLGGRGKVEILGAELAGRCGIEARPSSAGTAAKDHFEVWAEGDLFWQGRKWLGGRLSVGSKGLKIAGQTRFGLKITPDSIPGTATNLAHLFLTIGLDGEFRLDPAMQNHSFRFSGDWTLSAGLPDTGNSGNKQSIPLASNAFRFDSAVSGTLPLFDITGFKFLPLDNLALPKPGISIDSANGARTMMRAGELDDDSGSSAVELWTPFGWIGMRSNNPVPYMGAQSMKSPIRQTYSAYKANINWQNVALSPSAWSDLSLKLSLQKDAASGLYPLRLTIEFWHLAADCGRFLGMKRNCRCGCNGPVPKL